jgi:2-amino-4-hydroxy-6-hydroxymethyldihydropteridine diphosphokinase
MYKLDQDKFCNSVAGCRTFHSPEQLLHIIEKIMTLLGRVRVEKNGPRSIDIDILFYDDIKIQNPSLTIPHPKIAERKFVLSGLKEVGFVF